MEGNFLNQKPYTPSYPGVFQFGILFSVFIWISVLEPSSSPSSSFIILFIHSAFSSWFLVGIFLSKIVRFFLHPVVCMFSCHSLPIVDRISFRCFGKSFFCLDCFTLCWYLFNLPSFASTFWFISSSVTVIFYRVACFFFPAYFSASLSLFLKSFWLVFIVFF